MAFGFQGGVDMIRQWNFIIDNKLITVYGKDKKQAKKEAMKIFEDLKKEEKVVS